MFLQCYGNTFLLLWLGFTPICKKKTIFVSGPGGRAQGCPVTPSLFFFLACKVHDLKDAIGLSGLYGLDLFCVFF